MLNLGQIFYLVKKQAKHNPTLSINTKTIHFVLLDIVTGGIYKIIWMFLNTQKLEKSKKIADNTFLTWIAVGSGLWVTLDYLGNLGNLAITSENVTLGIIASLISTAFLIAALVLYIAALVLYIVWSFRARRALQEYALTEHKIDLRMNRFYTFIFNAFYINYCVNDLPEAQRKQQIITGKTATNES